MRRPLTIGFDLDGVLADFNTAFTQRIKMVTGRNLFPQGYDPRTPPVWNYPKHFGYTPAEVSAVWEDIKRDRVFWYMLDPLPSREWLFETFSPNGTNRDWSHPEDVIYFITSRVGARVHAQCVEWVRKFLWIPNAQVLIASDKGPLARALHLDVFIDDKLENAIEVATQSHGTQACLYDQPWNRQYPADEDELYRRIAQLSTFLSIIEGTRFQPARRAAPGTAPAGPSSSGTASTVGTRS